jgi:protease-4
MARRGIAIVFVLLGVAFLLSMSAFVAMYLLVGRTPSVPANAVLTLEIGGDLAEMAPTDVVTVLTGSRRPTVRGVVDNLHKAKVDKRVSAVFLKLTGFSTPYWGKVQEIREALDDFHSSGKPVYAYLEYGGDRDYYLATAADKIFLMPSATLDLVGDSSYELFLRGSFDKLGVYPDIHHIGKYKTAANQYTEKSFTESHREMTDALNRDLYDQIVDVVAGARKQTPDAIRALIDDGPFLAADAARVHLIDAVAYEDQARQELKDLDGSRTRDLDGVAYGKVSLTSLGLNRGPRVAVIYASGAITGGESGFDPLNGTTVGSKTLIEAIRAARKDDRVKALVLRVDSPGGSAPASDAIWRELMLAREERADRPIVVSMSDLAASGGYYIAMPADAIVAQPSTLTGSIGIFGGKFVTGGLYEKLGANIEATSIGKHAQINSPVRPYNADETAKVEQQLNAFYTDFVGKAAKSRKMTWEQVHAIAQGRVWTGRQAKEQGLVDEIGGLDRAVALAKERAGIAAESGVELVTYPSPKSLYQVLSDSFSGASDRAMSAWLQTHLSTTELEVLRAARGPATLFKRGEMLALMPFTYLR